MQPIRVARVKAAIAVALLAVVAACSMREEQLSRTDIQLAAADVRTFAASAQLLIEQCSAGRASTTFCHEEAEMLSSKIHDALSELNGQGGTAEYERREVEEIATRLREIVLRSRNAANLVSDGDDAGRLASTAKTVEDSLRK